MLPPETRKSTENIALLSEYDSYLMGKSCFDSKEFERAAFFLEDCQSNQCYFLKAYSMYLVSITTIVTLIAYDVNELVNKQLLNAFSGR